MKHTIIAALALAFASQVSGKCTASDKWRGPDKVMHAQAGALIGAIGAIEGDYWRGVQWSGIAAVAKEAVDATGSGTCSLQDALVTVAGGMLGAAVGKGLYLTFDPRAKSVQVGVNIALP